MHALPGTLLTPPLMTPITLFSSLTTHNKDKWTPRSYYWMTRVSRLRSIAFTPSTLKIELHHVLETPLGPQRRTIEQQEQDIRLMEERIARQEHRAAVTARLVAAVAMSWIIPIFHGIYGVRLKLAFCTTCAVRILVLAQGPSFLRLRRALLRRRGDLQDKRSATITSGGVETIQRSCSTSTEETEVVW